MGDLLWCIKKPNFPQMGRKKPSNPNYSIVVCLGVVRFLFFLRGSERERSRCVEMNRKPLKVRGKNPTSQPNVLSKHISIEAPECVDQTQGSRLHSFTWL